MNEIKKQMKECEDRLTKLKEEIQDLSFTQLSLSLKLEKHPIKPPIRDTYGVDGYFNHDFR